MANDAPIVYIVDDDAGIRESLSVALQDEGFLVREACDGLDGVAQLRASVTPAVVLPDLTMPRLDGLEVLRLAANDPAALGRHAFIVVTANRRLLLPDEHAALAGRHIPILRKPFDLAQMLDAVALATERLA